MYLSQVRRLYHERLDKKAFKMAIVLMLRDLKPQERAQKIEELTQKEFDIPYSRKKMLSRSAIYQWLKEYREADDRAGVLLARPRCDRGVFRKLTEPQKKALMRWRHDNPYRSAAELREELMAHDITSQGPVPSTATITRFLRSVGLDRRTLVRTRRESGSAKVRLSYEASHPQSIWLADTKGPDLYVQDPANAGQLVLARPILFVDDHSRYYTAFSYVLEETEKTVMLLFRRAIALFGVPDILYVDRGSPYMGKSLERAAALVGCRVTHTKVRDPAAKGKVEKAFQYIYQKLETELLLRTPPPTIGQANEYLAALITQDYHRRIHSSTGQTPEERFLSFPPKYRRFVSDKALTMIFLPFEKAHVTKTGLIRLNKRQYLAPDLRLYNKWVEVRYDPLDLSKVYVWFQDEFFGEANLYVPDDDYLNRQELIEKMKTAPEITLPSPEETPPYSYLERKLAAYRLEVEMNSDLNEELALNKAKKQTVRAELLKVNPPVGTDYDTDSSTALDAGGFAHLLSRLLKRSFAAHERLLIHTAWRVYGPFSEEMVRQTVGRLFGESHPASDLSGFLDALRIAAESWPAKS